MLELSRFLVQTLNRVLRVL